MQAHAKFDFCMHLHVTRIFDAFRLRVLFKLWLVRTVPSITHINTFTHT